MLENRDDYALAHGIDSEMVVSYATTGSGPSASFLGSDMRAAYYGGTALTGAGQNLGLFEYVGTDLADLTTYFKNAGQTNNVPITLLSTDGTSTSCVYSKAGGNCDDTEQTLDMTQAIGMAPGLASLVVYIGSSDTAIIGAMVSHSPLPATIGCSWGWTPVDPTSLNPYFEKMAAQGQNFFVASGDSSTWTKQNYSWPAEDANVVTVGGTDLITASAGRRWSSETAWADSGGGISPDSIAIPSWQKLSGVINSATRARRRFATARTYRQTRISLSMFAPTRQPALQTCTVGPALPRPCGRPTLRWSTSSWLQEGTGNWIHQSHDLRAECIRGGALCRICHELPRHRQRRLGQLLGG